MKNKTFKAFLIVVALSTFWAVLIGFLMMDSDKSIYFKVLNIGDYIAISIFSGIFILIVYSLLFLLAIPVHLFYRKKSFVSVWFYIVPPAFLSVCICLLLNYRVSSVGEISPHGWQSWYLLEAVVVISVVSLSKVFVDSFYGASYKKLLVWFFASYFIALTIVAVLFFKERHSELKRKELAELKVDGSSIEKYKESISIISEKLDGEDKAKFDEAVAVVEFVAKDAAYIVLKGENYEQVIESKNEMQETYVELFNLDRKRKVIDCLSDEYFSDYNKTIVKINDGEFSSDILKSLLALEKEAAPYLEKQKINNSKDDVENYKKIKELFDKEVADFDVAKNSTPLEDMEDYCKSPIEIRARIIEITEKMKKLIQ